MSSAHGYATGRRRATNHHATGTISVASGYAIARPVTALPANCGKSCLATANTSSPTRAAFNARSSTSTGRSRM